MPRELTWLRPSEIPCDGSLLSPNRDRLRASRASGWPGTSIVVRQNVSATRLMSLYNGASIDRCRASDSKPYHGGHPSIGGHRQAFLVQTITLCKPRAVGTGLQR